MSSSGTITASATSFSFSPSATFASSSTSSAYNATAAQQQQDNTPNTFYKNLFYILIGLLAAFGIVSFLSLLRARRRRNQIIQEAERLGVMVPGMEGYVPMRERRALNWLKADGQIHDPEWWEIGPVKWGPAIWRSIRGGSVDLPSAIKLADEPASGTVDEKKDLGLEDVSKPDFLPLSVIPPAPPLPPLNKTPVPRSELPYFPNHLAYFPNSIQPYPPKPVPSKPSDAKIEEAVGEIVDVVAIIKMPMRPLPGEPEEGEEVYREWSGMEVGITKMEMIDRP